MRIQDGSADFHSFPNTDPRYLFIIALAIVIGTFSFFEVNPELAIGVFFVGGGLVIVLTVLDQRDSGFRMAIALQFPGEEDPTGVTLRRCEYEIGDPREPGVKRRGEVQPYKGGGGWLCPLPSEAKASDVIDLKLTDTLGRQWAVDGFVLELQWPAVPLRRV